jgi:hypothetical protein
MFVQGEFKPSGYYAECVDLIRKLVLSGMVSLLAPGTVMQSFATAWFSLVFMVIHAHTCESVSPVCASIHRQFTYMSMYASARHSVYCMLTWHIFRMMT